MARAAFIIGEQIDGTFYIGRLEGWGDLFVVASDATMSDGSPWPENGEVATGLGERLGVIPLPPKPKNPDDGDAWRAWGRRCRQAVERMMAERNSP